MSADSNYHLDRERACREMAANAADGAIRRIHQQMAERHAELARRSDLRVAQAQSPAPPTASP